MSGSILITVLMLAGAALAADPRSVRVELFWNHLPHAVKVRPLSRDAAISECSTCAYKPWSSALSVTSSSHRELRLHGSYRLETDSRPAMDLNAEAVITGSSNGVRVVLTVPREEYVAAVLAGETPADAPASFLQAMAVAIRTYAFRTASRHANERFDFCDSTHCQAAHFGTQSAPILNAVASTRNEMLWFGGHPALTYYHQDCGGTTASERDVWPAASPVAYLPVHEDPYCVRAHGVQWHSSLQKSDLVNALARSGIHVPRSPIAVAARSSSGRVRTLAFGADEVSATSFRFAVGRALGWQTIRSDWYELHDEGDAIQIDGRGSGHGVGLCQNGAMEMAREGKSYQEILGFYYPGTKLGISAGDIPWKVINGDGFTIWSTRPEKDGKYLPEIRQIASRWESATGLKYGDPFAVKIYPDTSTYRDSTGAPGWMSAYTERNTIHLQPTEKLAAGVGVETTLRHELLHELLESNTHVQLPLWFREGIAEYLMSPSASGSAAESYAYIDAQLSASLADAGAARAAHREAREAVAALAQRYGREQLLSWLRTGLPRDLSLQGRGR